MDSVCEFVPKSGYAGHKRILYLPSSPLNNSDFLPGLRRLQASLPAAIVTALPTPFYEQRLKLIKALLPNHAVAQQLPLGTKCLQSTTDNGPCLPAPHDITVLVWVPSMARTRRVKPQPDAVLATGLIDSGASHCFVSEAQATTWGLDIQASESKPQQVTTANADSSMQVIGTTHTALYSEANELLLHKLELKVVSNLSMPLILGRNWPLALAPAQARTEAINVLHICAGSPSWLRAFERFWRSNTHCPKVRYTPIEIDG